MTDTMTFRNEAEFENAVITNLTQNHGWDDNVLRYPTEQDLIDNWAEIVFQNNKARLNNIRLSDAEKHQLLEKVSVLDTTAKVQEFLQGTTVDLIRDNPADTENHGHNVILKIFDPHEVGGGESKYQIAQQPRLGKQTEFDKDRRGDFLLLIWGMPVIHVELKNSNHDVNEAVIQMAKQAEEGHYLGIMNLVQVNVAMTPDDMVYFARPDSIHGYTSSTFHFRWTNSDNELITSWKDVIAQFMGIPYAHELIGNFLIPDKGDGVLKAMRPYQIHAANAIIQRMKNLKNVPAIDWDSITQKGGYIWHTTGSGKTMTSFKTASLLARDGLADRIVFVLDRIELGEQTKLEFDNFTDAVTPIYGTRRTSNLVTALWDKDNKDRNLIVTSIDKLGIVADPSGKYAHENFAKLHDKKIVFIVDEAHRSVHSDRFSAILKAFPRAVFFGFTGTPIKSVNAKNGMDTTLLFGDELHRYSIIQGLRDKNVLGFDETPVPTFNYNELRKQVALREAVAKDELEVFKDARKKEIYEKFMDPEQVPWVTPRDSTSRGDWGIEDRIPPTQWTDDDTHHKAVVDYILENWVTFSKGNFFHGMLVASSIEEAISYYKLFKAHNDNVEDFDKGKTNQKPNYPLKLRVTAVFHAGDKNHLSEIERDKAVKEILADYKDMYGTTYSTAGVGEFYTDVADRLGHKKGYRTINPESDQRLDLVIVVAMMLTGYDSKFVNAIYLDKVLVHEHLIQAMSRTNRVMTGKSHGIISYFRKVRTMERNIDEALELYSDGEPLAIFVDPLPVTLKKVNNVFEAITHIFETENIQNFATLPSDPAAKRQFAIKFSELNQLLETALLQGFSWSETLYKHGEETVEIGMSKQVFETLQARYSELATDRGPRTVTEPIPFDLHALAAARDSRRIDFEYLDAKVKAFRKAIHDTTSCEDIDRLRSEVQRSFAVLSLDDQAVARMILQDIETGKIVLGEAKSFRELLADYKSDKQQEHIEGLAKATGIDADAIKKILVLSGTPVPGATPYYEEYGRRQGLEQQADKDVFSAWLEQSHGVHVSEWVAGGKLTELLIAFFDQEGFDVEEWDPDGS